MKFVLALLALVPSALRQMPISISPAAKGPDGVRLVAAAGSATAG